jgi:imidazolonepropionase-like amidohydrolase
LLFLEAEMCTIVNQAHEAECPVAAHATSPTAVIRAAQAGLDSVQHGQEPSTEALIVVKEMGRIFVRTLTVIEEVIPQKLAGNMDQHRYKAWKAGSKLASGGDNCPIAHGKNVRELELVIVAGILMEDVMMSATLHDWEACGGTCCGRSLGRLVERCVVDLVKLKGDPGEDFKSLRRVAFAMKDGRVWKIGNKMIA